MMARRSRAETGVKTPVVGNHQQLKGESATKKKTIVREVYRSNWNGMDCMMIADPDGEIDRA